MLAEIFLMRIEMMLRAATATPPGATSDTRFVPFTPPRESKPAPEAQ